MARASTSEAGRQDTLTNLCRTLGLLVVKHESLTGMPDLEVYLPNGRSFFIETKRFDTDATDIQKYTHKQLGLLGFDVILGNGDLDELKETIKQKFDDAVKERRATQGAEKSVVGNTKKAVHGDSGKAGKRKNTGRT